MLLFLAAYEGEAIVPGIFFYDKSDMCSLFLYL